MRGTSQAFFRCRRLTLIVPAALAATACQSQLSLSTFPPGAAVYSNDKKIGVTPLDIDEVALGAPQAGGNLLLIEKENHKRLWLWIPAGSGGSYSINMQSFIIQKDDQQASKSSEYAAKQNLYRISRSFIEAQNLVFSKKFDEAAPKIEQMSKDYGAVGTAFYLDAVQKIGQGKQDAALESLRRAAELAPEIVEFTALYNRMGGKKDVQATQSSVPAK